MDVLLKSLPVVIEIIVLLLFTLPSYVSAVRQHGFFRGTGILLALAGYSVALLTLAVKTGIPYGRFTYDSSAGYKLFGTTPWIVALVYPLILLAAFWAASKFTHSGLRIVLAGAFATLMDVVLDPAMVKLEFWQWDHPGLFYGVPVINFVGWLAAAALGAGLLHVLWNKEWLVHRGIAYSGLIFMLFWTGANVGIGQWLPAAVGGVICGLMLLLAGLEKWKTAYEKA